MKKIALLPARLGSTRFPEKMLADLGGLPLIVRTAQAVTRTDLFDKVVVVTDHERIFEAVKKSACEVVMSSPEHQSGSDRIAEIARTMPEYDIVVNVQGDEPFTSSATLAEVLSCFHDPQVQVASAMCPLADGDDLLNPNVVKVAVNEKMDALYFSRAPIPFPRDAGTMQVTLGQHFQHIGIYGYRREALLEFTSWPVCALENTEKLEQLRLLWHGVNIRMALTQEKPIGIDTPADLDAARIIWHNR